MTTEHDSEQGHRPAFSRSVRRTFTPTVRSLPRKDTAVGPPEKKPKTEKAGRGAGLSVCPKLHYLPLKREGRKGKE